MAVRVDAVILTALLEEYEACCNYADTKLKRNESESGRDVSLSTQSTDKFYVTATGVTFAIAAPSGMGEVNAALGAERAIRRLRPSWVLLAGIAGGMAKNPNVGNIVVPDNILNYDLQKAIPGSNEIRPVGYQTSKSLRDGVMLMHKQPFLDKIFDKYCSELNPESTAPEEQKISRPEVIYKPMISGNQVVADEKLKLKLRNLNPSAAAVEMEASGIASAIGDYPHVEFLPIKAIVDKATKEKGDTYHRYGCELAAMMAVELIIQKGKISAQQFDAGSMVEDLRTKLKSSIGGAKTEALDAMIDAYTFDAVTHLEKLLKPTFQKDISQGPHFLRLAAPLFSKSRKMYSTSVDAISTFWENENNRVNACDYLDLHPPKHSHRLFVFSSARRAHAYAQILDAHAERYGRAYVCSETTYRSLRTQLTVNLSESQWISRDFALLFSRERDNRPQYIARLTETNFEWEQIANGNSVVQGIELDAVARMFEGWARNRKEGGIMPGELKGEKILRWDKNMWKERDVWADRLKTMFTHLDADTMHIVFFDLPTDSSTRNHIKSLRREVQRTFGKSTELGKRYSIGDIWLGEKASLPVKDGVYNGQLRTFRPGTSHQDQYALIIKFGSKESLSSFYEDKDHSKIRGEFYRSINPQAVDLYRCADHFASARLSGCKEIPTIQIHPEGNNGDIASLIFRSIEACISEQMRRADYCTIEDVEEMVRYNTPIEFLHAPREHAEVMG